MCVCVCMFALVDLFACLLTVLSIVCIFMRINILINVPCQRLPFQFYVQETDKSRMSTQYMHCIHWTVGKIWQQESMLQIRHIVCLSDTNAKCTGMFEILETFPLAFPIPKVLLTIR